MTSPLTDANKPVDLVAHYRAVKVRLAARATISPDTTTPADKSARAKPPPLAIKAPATGAMRMPMVVLVHPTANALNPAVKPPERPHIRVRAVVEPILKRHETPWADLIGPSRKRHLMAPRLAVYAALHNAGFSLKQIGRFCRRDHTTILHYLFRYAGYQKSPRPNPYRVTFK